MVVILCDCYLFYLFLSNFIPLLIPSDFSIFSCLQYSSNIELHSSSNLTVILSVLLGLLVGLPIFLGVSIFLPSFRLPKLIIYLCQTKFNTYSIFLFSLFFIGYHGFKMHFYILYTLLCHFEISYINIIYIFYRILFVILFWDNPYPKIR